eukprot:580988-Hanusia_phi.AAC.3
MKILRQYPALATASRINVWFSFDGCRLGKSSQSNSSHTEFTFCITAEWDGDSPKIREFYIRQETRMKSQNSLVTFALMNVEDSAEHVKKNFVEPYRDSISNMWNDQNVDGKTITAGLHFHANKRGKLTCINGRKKSMETSALVPDKVVPLSFHCKGDLKGLWSLSGISESTKERHRIFDLKTVTTATSVAEFCKDSEFSIVDFWIMNNPLMPPAQRGFLQACTLNDQGFDENDLRRMISTKDTGLLVEHQRVLVLRQNDAELRDVGPLDFLGDDIMEILVACMLHCRIRMVQMFLRFVFKIATKNGNDMIQDVLNVFKKHNVTYDFDMKKKNDYSAVTSLDGTECIRFQEDVIPGIIEVIYAGQPEKQA